MTTKHETRYWIAYRLMIPIQNTRQRAYNRHRCCAANRLGSRYMAIPYGLRDPYLLVAIVLPPEEEIFSNSNLRIAYPWLRHRHEGDLYLSPEAYRRLLKSYIFEGTSDLDHFRQFLEEVTNPQDQVILELGPGTGRTTDVLLERLDQNDLTCSTKVHE